MGYALFTARKMSLQAKVNQYNLQLMKIENEKTALTEKTARLQRQNNRIDAAQNRGAKGASLVGGIIGFACGGVLGAGAGSSIGGGLADLFNGGIDQVQKQQQEYQQQELARKQQELDTEKQRIDTLLKQASSELQKVEEAEQSAIEKSAPKYVA